MRRMFHALYEKEFQTLEEYRNNFNYFGITLHFHNIIFELENDTIGFEELNREFTYTGEVLSELLMEVLKKYRIDNRIASLTRDKAAPTTAMMDKSREWSRSQVAEFDGDIRCVGHLMNLSTVAHLNYTLFKRKVSKKFDKSMEELPEEKPHFKDFAYRLKHSPRIMRLIIVQRNFCHKMKSNSKDLVKEIKEKELSNCGPEKMSLNNASTYRMIDRFLLLEGEDYTYFEIELEIFYGESCWSRNIRTYR